MRTLFSPYPVKTDGQAAESVGEAPVGVGAKCCIAGLL